MSLNYSNFPVHVFPSPLSELIKENSICYGFSPEYLGLSMLVCAGAMLGNAYAVQERGNIHSAIIYGMLVGESSVGKTPAARKIVNPIWDIERRFRDRYGVMPERNIIVNDSTIEALCQELDHNPYGILFFKDELKGWLSSIRYLKEDASNSFWQENWSNETFKVKRISGRQKNIERSYICVLGTIQPSHLDKITSRGKAKDGFLSRFLFAYPEWRKKALYNDRQPPEDLIENWSKVLTWISDINYQYLSHVLATPRAKINSIKVPLSIGAKRLFINLYNQNVEIINESDDEVVKSIIGKFDSYSLRLALILEVLQHSCDLAPDLPTLEETENWIISEESMTGSIELIQYFTETSGKVWDLVRTEKLFLGEKKLKWLNMLPDDFSTKEAKDAAAVVELSLSTMYRLLSNQSIVVKLGSKSYRKKN